MILPDRSVPVPDEVLSGLVAWSLWRGCLSKGIRAQTRREARWWRRWVFLTYGRRTVVYRCRWCGGLHLATKA